MASPVAETFRHAARLNRDDPQRRGNVIRLTPENDVIITGDLHGNRFGFNSIVKSAALNSHPNRRLIIQEVVHGPVDERTGKDRSIELLLRIARLKISYPQQVLFVMGNHDVAEITGNEISRDGQPSCKTFAEGVAYAFQRDVDEILEALKEFLWSLPLMIRFPNGVQVSHSLPAPGRLGEACFEVTNKPYAMEDLRRGGGVYEWTWGRNHTPELADDLAEKVDAKWFIIGHLHTPEGYRWVTPRTLTLASDHPQGTLMHISAGKELTRNELENAVQPIANATIAQ